MTLQTLQKSIETLVRDTNPDTPVFLADEYSNAIAQALQQYSIDKKRYLPYVLDLVAGQERYDLPDDWIAPDIEQFDELMHQADKIDYFSYAGFVLPSLNALPALNKLRYNWYNDERYLIISPAPTMNSAIQFSYFALHKADNMTYTIPITDEQAVANLVASILLDILAVDRGTKMQRYKIGQGLDIDDSTVAVRLQELSRTYRMVYNKLVHRPIGVMG